jgi:tRNA nucleotidyltransferase/poly(A) polymerase
VIPDRLRPVLERVAPLAERFAEGGFTLYLVGGVVRDLLLGGTSRGAATSTSPPMRDRRTPSAC